MYCKVPLLREAGGRVSLFIRDPGQASGSKPPNVMGFL